MTNTNLQNNEMKWTQYWEDNQIYQFDRQSTQPLFSIDNPPPTISGSIHIGHIFSYTQTDIIARYKKMAGYSVFYPFGFDDNGLPTERLVEKELGKKGADLPRQEFVNACLQVTKKYGEQFKSLRKSVGISADRNLEYSTISPAVQKISQRSFVELYNKGLIYNKAFPGLRCPECQTCVAQAEVEDKEQETIFYRLDFRLEHGETIEIATTRPEYLPACVGVFVNPNDERFKSFIGTLVTTPLGHKVRLLADEKALMDKGSGAVMCCSYGDETDAYWIKTHNLEEKLMIDKAGRICNVEYPDMIGLSLIQGRKYIVEKLRAQGSIVKEVAITHSVGCHERCGTMMEIFPTSQWFINLLDNKEKFLELGNQIKRYPDYMHKRYDEWVSNLKRDWCISRQRFFGIPVPARRSKKTGELILPELDQLPCDPTQTLPKVLPERHTIEDIEPETDVLDTRATSGLTPQINAHWGEADELKSLLPMTLRTQAHEIIRTRTFYTIVKSWYHSGQIPWNDIMISGFVADSKGDKISKSKGNAGKTPEELIAVYGADAVRYRTTNAQMGKDIKFDEQEFKIGQKLVKKLENCANFVFMNLSDYDPNIELTEEELCPMDLRMLNQVNLAGTKMTELLNAYEIGSARNIFEKLFRHDFCDHYLEIVKERIYKPEKYTNSVKQKLSAQFTLHKTLYALIRMIAPMMPFIAEELYDKYFKSYAKKTSIHLLNFPDGNNYEIKQDMSDIQKTVERLFEIIEQVRAYKTDKKIGLGTELELLTIKGDKMIIGLLQSFQNDIRSVTRAARMEFSEGEEFGIIIEL